jgi:hypothetical protein
MAKVWLRNVVKCGKYSLANFANFVLREEIATTFGPKMVGISARNTKVYKILKLCKVIFYNISQPNFAILLILVCSSFLAVVIYLHLFA